jgi:hypothetical protein
MVSAKPPNAPTGRKFKVGDIIHHPTYPQWRYVVNELHKHEYFITMTDRSGWISLSYEYERYYRLIDEEVIDRVLNKYLDGTTSC